MIRLCPALFFSLLSLTVTAQTNPSKFDLRLGVGGSFLGSGDLWATMIENEVNYTLNSYFTASGSLAYGKSEQETTYPTSSTTTTTSSTSSSFLQGNINLFLSPFRNTLRNDFRIGGGLSYYAISDTQQTFNDFVGNSEEPYLQTQFERRNALGFNIIIENTFELTERLLIGGKAFTQPYLNGDINSGIMLKFGVRL